MKKYIFIMLIVAFISFITNFDDVVANFFVSIRHPYITPIMHAFSFFGGKIFLIGINIAIVIYFIIKKRPELGLMVALLTLACWLTTSLIKICIRRQRPPVLHLTIEKSFSFPSGHATSATAFYYNLNNYILKRKIYNYLFIFFVSMIMISRLYLGVHYLSDVLTGCAISLAISYIVKVAYSKYRDKQI